MAQGDVGIYASQISGHLWAPNGAMDALATVTVPSGGVATIEFAGIPQGYRNLQIRYSTRTSQYSGGYSYTDMYMTFNGDTTTNYSYHGLTGNGSSPSAGGGTSSSNIVLNTTIDSATSNIYLAGVTDILNYASTSKNKTTRTLEGFDVNGGGSMFIRSGNWRNSTTGITSIKFTPYSGNFMQYTKFALYGVK